VHIAGAQKPVDDQAFDHFPALRGRSRRPIDQHTDEARRFLLRAYQHGTLTEEELARTLDRIATPLPFRGEGEGEGG
jgi:hypothetical protein